MSEHYVVSLGHDEDDDTRQVLRVTRDGTVVQQESDGGEPEDQSFYRDWRWVPDALRAAYAYGLEDARRGVEASPTSACKSTHESMRCVFVDGHDGYHLGGSLTWEEK